MKSSNFLVAVAAIAAAYALLGFSTCQVKPGHAGVQ